MSDDMKQLSDVIELMKAEITGMKTRLEKLERVVSIDEDEDGLEQISIDCTSLVVRNRFDERRFAVHIGATEEGGFLDVHYTGSEHASKSAISLAIQGDGEPHIQVRGKDWKPRVDIAIQNDLGLIAVLGPDNAAGAVMRAQPGGGSVAVLQADGKTRAVLVHNELAKHHATGVITPSTDLLFARADGQTMLKLHSDGESTLMSSGAPDQPDCLSILTGNGGATMMMYSPNKENNITLAATASIAQISAHQGVIPGEGAEASLLAGSFGSSMMLHECDGSKRVDLSAMRDTATVVLLDSEGKDAVALSHFSGSHSSLAMRGSAEHDCFRFIANKDAALLRITSPDNPDTEISTAVYENKPHFILRQNKTPLVMAGESGHGGVVCAYGPEEVQGGIASLAGGPMGGVVSISARDGTELMTLDGTDHGGRLLINNDLGFQRVVIGVHEEAAAISLNNTGSNGVVATATAKGGIVSVCDAEGKVVRYMTGTTDDDDDDRKNWGKLTDDE